MSAASKFKIEVTSNRAFREGDDAGYWSVKDAPTAARVDGLPEWESDPAADELKLPSVLMQVTHASKCASDVRVLAGNKGHDLLKGGGIVLGHEGGGYVIDPGPYATHLRAGQMAAILPHVTCGACRYCRAYKQNLCPRMAHLGFHLNGILAGVMSFPPQCIWSVPAQFNPEALPLIEPTACVLHALFRVRDELTRIAQRPSGSFTVWGGGPMGVLIARCAKRRWPTLTAQMIEPNPRRRRLLEELRIADTVAAAEPGSEVLLGFVASSALSAYLSALAAVRHGGTLVLFSGINSGDLVSEDLRQRASALALEHIHREELDVRQVTPLGHSCRLIGSSGYICEDAERSRIELCQHYEQYSMVQNVCVHGLDAKKAHYRWPIDTWVDFKERSAVEVFYSPNGLDDEFGEAVAASLKILIKL